MVTAEQSEASLRVRLLGRLIDRRRIKLCAQPVPKRFNVGLPGMPIPPAKEVVEMCLDVHVADLDQRTSAKLSFRHLPADHGNALPGQRATQEGTRVCENQSSSRFIGFPPRSLEKFFPRATGEAEQRHGGQ